MGFHCQDQKPAENPNLFQVLGESARISRPAWQLRGEARSGCPWALGSFPGNKSRHSDPCPQQQQRREEPLSLWMSNITSNSVGGKRLGHAAAVRGWQHTSTSEQRCFQHQMVKTHTCCVLAPWDPKWL